MMMSNTPQLRVDLDLFFIILSVKEHSFDRELIY